MVHIWRNAAIISLLLSIASGALAQVSDNDGNVVPQGPATPPDFVLPPDGEEEANGSAARLRSLGRPCLEADQCRSGRCSVGAVADPGRGRTPTRPIAGVCIPNDGTARVGRFCTDTDQCRRGSCKDARCTLEDLSGTCSANSNCRSGQCFAGLCVSPPGTGPSGSFCTRSSQCGSGYCGEGECIATNNLAFGEVCASNNQCQSGVCNINKYCGVPDNTATLGENCHSHSSCVGDLICNKSVSPAVCGNPYKQNGESCATQGVVGIIGHPHLPPSKNECISQRCDFDTNKCIPNDGEGVVGSFCSHNNQCQPGDQCLANECTAPFSNQPLGELCTGNADCLSNICDGHENVCVAQNNTVEAGQFCTQDDQCQNNLVCVSGYDADYNDYDSLENTCAPPSTELGERCSRYLHTKDPCVTGYCDSGFGSGNDFCTANDGTARIGDWCDHDNQCATLNCNQDADPSRCEAVGPLAMGQVCELHGDCQSGRCDGTNVPRRCIPNNGTGVVGESCSHNNNCLGGLRCASTVSSPSGYGICLE